MLWPERKSRQDISVLVNHWGDIYYLMAAGSPSKASSGLGSLLQKEMLALTIPDLKKVKPYPWRFEALYDQLK